mmetsp:Transcript_32478/g.49695  ORF Transcript_32478/g.49695 Transcript_32478/m.49695 type:complete len:122 (+) Transcript_32478:127-492(+)
MDQDRVNDLFFDRKIPFVLLDTTRFPNDYMIMWGLINLEQSVIAHINWLDNAKDKKEVLKEKGLWYINDGKYKDKEGSSEDKKEEGSRDSEEGSTDQEGSKDQEEGSGDAAEEEEESQEEE